MLACAHLEVRLVLACARREVRLELASAHMWRCGLCLRALARRCAYQVEPLFEAQQAGSEAGPLPAPIGEGNRAATARHVGALRIPLAPGMIRPGA